MAAKPQLKKVGTKQIAVDIQIAAGMVCLALFSPGPQGGQDQQQQQGQQPPQQDQQGAPQGQGGPQLPPGLQSIGQVLQGANDPAAALAHVVFMAISKVEQALDTKGIQIDDRVWIMGGGVVDRVMVEVITAIASILHFQPALDPKFSAQVKSDILDLMDDDDRNTEAMKVLHQKGLPLPKPPSDPTGQSGGGLAAPQGGAPQQQDGGQ